MDRRTWLHNTLITGTAAVGSPWLTGCSQPAAWQGSFVGQNLQRGHQLRDAPQPPADLPVQRCDTVICGGGVAGLAAARALEQAGRTDWVLLELQDALGGNSQAGSLQGLPCPLGAHYLPLPGPSAPELQALLEELGLCRWEAGRWVYDERHLCHSPQERIYWQGAWHEGLLPAEGVSAATLAQYRQFAFAVQEVQRQGPFHMPTLRHLAEREAVPAFQQALDQGTFAEWLDARGLTDPQLRWYLDYCCRDDFGAGTARVSAWAGLHYFASRGGWSAPGSAAQDSADAPTVLTWPEGNGWLTRQITRRLGPAGRLRTAHTVFRVEEATEGVQVTAYDHQERIWRRWHARQAVVALPLQLAVRVVQPQPDWLQQAARHLQYAPWLVANLHLRQPLRDRPGAAPAWDNVLFDDPVPGGLGYVDATHQNLDPRPKPTVLTYYQALGDALPASRTALLQGDWRTLAAPIVQSLQRPHPDLPDLLGEVALMRYGHAMAIPTPGTHTALQALVHGVSQAPRKPVRWQGENTQVLPVPGTRRLRFAHADWAGYSVFEEAFTRGHHAALSLLS